MDILALSVASLWLQWVWPILMFIIGLGLVVFVHELGHFMAAKAVGIKVKRFAVGMGPRVVGFRRGDTDYCLCAVPVGGYVSMQGQEDFNLPDTGQDKDPNAFNNKSVGARMLVVSAGVVMNVVLAAVLFILVSLVGIRFPAPIVGQVRPGYPAAEAKILWQDGVPPAGTSRPASGPSASIGLKSGDRIVKIHGPSLVLNLVGGRVTSFSDLVMTAMLAAPDDKFDVTIERTVEGRRYVGTAKMGVRSEASQGHLAFGVASAAEPVLAVSKDYVYRTPLRTGDRLLAVDGRTVAHVWDLPDIEASLTGQPVTLTVQRKGKKVDLQVQPWMWFAEHRTVLWLKDGRRVVGELLDNNGAVTVLLDDGAEKTYPKDEIAGGSLSGDPDLLGLIPRLAVNGVQKKSPADKAGIQPDDIIVGYGDRSAPTHRQLRQISDKAKGAGTNIVVLRDGQTHTFWIVPRSGSSGGELGLNVSRDLGHLVVAGIREGSPAANAGVPAEAEIVSVNGKGVATWIDLLDALKDNLDKPVSIGYRLGNEEKTADLGIVTKAQFDPKDFTFDPILGVAGFEPMLVTVTERNPLKAVAWGSRETVKFVLTSYLSLRSLIQGHVSAKAISGPVGIGDLAVRVARKSLIEFVYFIAFISAAIAVFNFLPIPVMDGGMAVFLLVEKVRGKPAPPKVVVAAQIVGWVLILGIFIAVTWNDIYKIVTHQ